MSGFLRIIIILFFSIFNLLLINGCETASNDELVPSYIQIDSIKINATYQQGTSSSKNTDAWVYINQQFLGSFELPATIPVLSSGKQKIIIRPGIKLNGISNTRNAYPFYASIEKELTLVKDSILNLGTLQTTYHPNVNFAWLESFELSGSSIDTTSKSTVDLSIVSSPGLLNPDLNGTGAALIELVSDSAIFEAATKEKFDFPGNGSAVFLEMNYKCNHPIIVGVIYMTSGSRVQRPLLTINKSEQWNKIYVNLSVPKYDTPDANNFQIFFGIQKESGTAKASILLDNLKLVHFKQ